MFSEKSSTAHFRIVQTAVPIHFHQIWQEYCEEAHAGENWNRAMHLPIVRPKVCKKTSEAAFTKTCLQTDKILELLKPNLLSPQTSQRSCGSSSQRFHTHAPGVQHCLGPPDHTCRVDGGVMELHGIRVLLNRTIADALELNKLQSSAEASDVPWMFEDLTDDVDGQMWSTGSRNKAVLRQLRQQK